MWVGNFILEVIYMGRQFIWVGNLFGWAICLDAVLCTFQLVETDAM